MATTHRSEQHRVPVAPYVAMFPNRPILWVLADHTTLVEVWFKDGDRAVVVKAEQEEEPR